MNTYANKTVCITDIANSTSIANEIGQEKYALLRDQHINMAKVFAKKHSGIFTKDTGDGALVEFSDPRQAIGYAINLIYLHKHYKKHSEHALNVRIGLSTGLVRTTTNDNYGPAINLAARLEQHANTEQLLVCDDIIESLSVIYGERIHQCISRSADFNFKGFETKTAHALDADKIYNLDFELSIYSTILKHIESLGFIQSNIRPHDFEYNNTIVLPIVPRHKINLVHCGLAKTLRILSFFDWKVCILIADFGQDNLTTQQISTFKESLQKYINKLGVTISETHTLSEIITNKNQRACCSITHNHLYPYLKTVKAGDMARILNKKYSESERFDNEKPYMNILRPLFTVAAVQSIAEKEKSLGINKIFVLSGDDERDMWSTCISYGNDDSIGAFHMPTISKIDKHQYNQNLTNLIWYNVKDIINTFQNSNIKEWASKIYHLDEFPSANIYISEENFKDSSQDQSDSSIAEFILRMLNSAN